MKNNFGKCTSIQIIDDIPNLWYMFISRLTLLSDQINWETSIVRKHVPGTKVVTRSVLLTQMTTDPDRNSDMRLDITKMEACV